jgi:hypothetical protein
MLKKNNTTRPHKPPSSNQPKIRNRISYFILILIVVLIGLASRNYSDLFPEWVKLYVGDTLWALNVFLILGFVFKKMSSFWLAAIAFAFSLLIEISQLYHTPWIDSMRTYKLIAVIIGFGFRWSDLVCYFVGVFIGVILEKTSIAEKMLFERN